MLGFLVGEAFRDLNRAGRVAVSAIVLITLSLGAVVDQVIATNPKAIADWRAGKTAAAKALVGQVMKATQGKANPAIVNRLIEEKLATL